jgi:hypothetical protein
LASLQGDPPLALEPIDASLLNVRPIVTIGPRVIGETWNPETFTLEDLRSQVQIPSVTISSSGTNIF